MRNQGELGRVIPLPPIERLDIGLEQDGIDSNRTVSAQYPATTAIRDRCDRWTVFSCRKFF